MHDASIDVYVAAAVARWDITRQRGQTVVKEPGVHGLLACPDDPLVRLVVTDDRAHDWLAGLLHDAPVGFISVMAAAGRCAELVGADPAWSSTLITAMIRRELQTVPALVLPGELTFRPVRRLDSDPPGGVPLEDAVAAALRADPGFDDQPDQFADYLRSLPRAVSLFAAVDRDGTVRATAGSSALGTHAVVLFVSTDPAWRRRGVGQAMTAAALNGARARGARQACLDANDAGLGIYMRLGFEAVSRMTQFFRAG